MRHQVAGRRLNRTSEHLQALLANLVTALIHHEQIRTTLPKAKEARRFAEKLITLARTDVLHKRRLVARTIRDGEALQKLFTTLGPRFAQRPGGYTRIIRLGRRLGDAAPMAFLELVERSPKTETPEAGEAKTAPKAAKAAKTRKPSVEAETSTEPKPKKAKGPGRRGTASKTSKSGVETATEKKEAKKRPVRGANRGR